VAVGSGDTLTYRTPQSAVLHTSRKQSTSHAAWGVGALVILVSAFFTLGLSLVLFVPYLIAWAVVSGRGRGGSYTLSVSRDGHPVTSPRKHAARLGSLAR
jgi:hypothetical protein